MAVTFMLSYISLNKIAEAGDPHRTAHRGRSGIFATVGWGALTDRVGRRPVYLFGCAVMVVWGIPLFLTVNTRLAG